MIKRKEREGKSYLYISHSKYNMELTSAVRCEKLSGILLPEHLYIDGESSFCYDITGFISMDKFISSHLMTEQLLREIFGQIQDIIIQAKDWLLNETEFFYTPQTIFFREEKIYLPWLPGAELDCCTQMEEIAEYLMKNIPTKDRQTAYFVYQLYRSSKLREFNWSVWDNRVQIQDTAFKQMKNKGYNTIIDEKSIEEANQEISDNFLKERPKAKQTVILFIFVCLIFLGISVYVAKNGWLRSPVTGHLEYTKVILYFVVFFIVLAYLSGKILYRGKEDELSAGKSIPPEQIIGGEETVLLEVGETEHMFYLIPVNREEYHLGYEKIELNSYPFLVGKDAGRVQGLVPANEVSRIHGSFVKEGDLVYYKDCNSTNGTKLNGNRLLSEEKYQIKQGDRIEFANICYLVESHAVN